MQTSDFGSIQDVQAKRQCASHVYSRDLAKHNETQRLIRTATVTCFSVNKILTAEMNV